MTTANAQNNVVFEIGRHRVPPGSVDLLGNDAWDASIDIVVDGVCVTRDLIPDRTLRMYAKLRAVTDASLKRASVATVTLTPETWECAIVAQSAETMTIIVRQTIHPGNGPPPVTVTVDAWTRALAVLTDEITQKGARLAPTLCADVFVELGGGSRSAQFALGQHIAGSIQNPHEQALLASGGVMQWTARGTLRFGNAELQTSPWLLVRAIHDFHTLPQPTSSFRLWCDQGTPLQFELTRYAAHITAKLVHGDRTETVYVAINDLEVLLGASPTPADAAHVDLQNAAPVDPVAANIRVRRLRFEPKDATKLNAVQAFAVNRDALVIVHGDALATWQISNGPRSLAAEMGPGNIVRLRSTTVAIAQGRRLRLMRDGLTISSCVLDEAPVDIVPADTASVDDTRFENAEAETLGAITIVAFADGRIQGLLLSRCTTLRGIDPPNSSKPPPVAAESASGRLQHHQVVWETSTTSLISMSPAPSDAAGPRFVCHVDDTLEFRSAIDGQVTEVVRSSGALSRWFADEQAWSALWSRPRAWRCEGSRLFTAHDGDDEFDAIAFAPDGTGFSALYGGDSTATQMVWQYGSRGGQHTLQAPVVPTPKGVVTDNAVIWQTTDALHVSLSSGRSWSVSAEPTDPLRPVVTGNVVSALFGDGMRAYDIDSGIQLAEIRSTWTEPLALFERPDGGMLIVHRNIRDEVIVEEFARTGYLGAVR